MIVYTLFSLIIITCVCQLRATILNFHSHIMTLVYSKMSNLYFHNNIVEYSGSILKRNNTYSSVTVELLVLLN